MNIALLREEERRYHKKLVVSDKVDPCRLAKDGFCEVPPRGGLKLGQHCIGDNSVAHWKCNVSWCECPCHDDDGMSGMYGG